MKDQNIIKSRMREILDGKKYYAFDIGASQELPSHWEKVKEGITFVAVEPDKKAARELERRYANIDYKVVPCGLSKSGGSQTLYCTATPTGASLLKVDEANPYIIQSYVFPITEIEIETITLKGLKELSSVEEINFIKLDTQGTELSILESLDNKDFEACIGIEVEVGVPGAYIGQPVMNEYNNFLFAKKFEIFDIRPSKLYHKGKKQNEGYYLNSLLKVYSDSPTVSRKTVECDFLYLKSPATIVETANKSLIRKAIITYITYNFFIEAFYLIEIAKDKSVISIEEAELMTLAVIEIHKEKEYSPIYSQSAFWTCIRKILRKFKIRARSTLYWSGYMFQGE